MLLDFVYYSAYSFDNEFNELSFLHILILIQTGQDKLANKKVIYESIEAVIIVLYLSISIALLIV